METQMLNKGKQMEETNWRKQVSFLLYELANHGIDSTQFKECLEHLQAKHDEWIFNNGN